MIPARHRHHVCEAEGCENGVSNPGSPFCRKCSQAQAAPLRQQRHRILAVRDVLDRLTGAVAAVRRLAEVNDGTNLSGSIMALTHEIDDLEQELATLCNEATMVLLERSLSRHKSWKPKVVEGYRSR